MKARIYPHGLDKWGTIMDAVHTKRPDVRDGILATVLNDPDNAVRAVVALSEFVEDQIAEARRALEVRCIIKEYLQEMGYDDDVLALERRLLSDEAQDEFRRRELTKIYMAEQFKRGPLAYARALRNCGKSRKTA